MGNSDLNVSLASFWKPDYLPPSAWITHAPFAFWLIERLAPSRYVELGTHYGYSYFAVCQAIERLSLGTTTFAIDTWRGDEHSGLYDDTVFGSVIEHNKRYESFSTLMKSTFDDALSYFDDGSIDLLHIDGRHHYDDARHDFQSWLPKLTDDAVVLFHDTNVREREFGVWRFFGELSAQHPSFQFFHGHGLGIVCPRGSVPNALAELMRAGKVEAQETRTAYAALGGILSRSVAASASERAAASASERAQADMLRREVQIAELAAAKADVDARLAMAESRLVEAEERRAGAEKAKVIAEEREAAAENAKLTAASRSVTDAEASAKRLEDGERLRDRLSAELALVRRRLAAKADEVRTVSDLLDRYHVAPALPLSERIGALLARQDDLGASLTDAFDLAQGNGIRVAALAAGFRIAERRLAGALALVEEMRSRVVAGSRSFGARATQRLLRRDGADDRADLSGVDAATAGFSRLNEGDLAILADHGVIDVPYYLAANPDIAEAGVDPVAHYFLNGASEGRRPHPHFDAEWYASQDPGIADAGLNPLIHYTLHGAAEDRPTRPNREAEAGVAALVLRASGLFDGAYYRVRYPDIVGSDEDALAHFIATGAAEGRDPSASFCTASYLADNPDVAALGINPLLHFALHGRREGRQIRPPTNDLRAGTDAGMAEAGLIRASGLFDPDWYALHYADVPATEEGAWRHFVDHGRREGRQPNPAFDPIWYAEHHPDTGGPAMALLHYIRHGASEGRDPSAEFDAAWYLDTYPDVKAGGGDALAHFVAFGRLEGRLPRRPTSAPEADIGLRGASHLFDPHWYVSRYPDVPRDVEGAWRHFLDHGMSEGRQPTAHFDPSWYAKRYTDVGGPPAAFSHYVRIGAPEGRQPSETFDPDWYLETYPDAAATAGGPLAHYLQAGRAEGRKLRCEVDALAASLDRLIARYGEAGDLQAATLLGMRKDGLQPILDRIAPYKPINVFVDDAKRNDPVVYVVLPSIRMEHATGGPNTAFILGCELAVRDVPVVFLSTQVSPDEDLGLIRDHLATITGLDIAALPIGFATVHDDARALGIGENDLFLATAWWTAQAVRSAARLCRNKTIFYLIQDYETTFYGGSAIQTMAQATYSFAHRPIINTSLLRDHLVQQKVGLFGDPDFGRAALVFEPAVDTALFFPEPRKRGDRRTLLFYARPNIAERNLFPNGVAALRSAIASGVFDDGDWEFVGMGEAFDPVPLGRGHVLTAAPWLGIDGYAAQMRRADLLLSLMLSPHPSYPPLEMAACGGVVVTTAYGSKTAERLAAISPLIIAVGPEIEALASGLRAGVELVRDREGSDRSGTTAFPKTWAESLSDVAASLCGEVRALWSDVERGPRLASAVAIVRADADIPDSPGYYIASARDRRSLYQTAPRAKSYSLVSTVYDTDPTFLTDLAQTVFAQDLHVDFEWLILDNGSSAAGTCTLLADIARHPRVRLERTPHNLGIVGGMKWCLDNARGDYILPVDSDDLLFPDCMRTIAAACEAAGYPTILYTDEDKIQAGHHRDTYLKPDWDPVLFFHSCFVAHLTVIDRRTALALGCYTDPAAEGSHDWDTFTRFFNAGHHPYHVPDVLYSWRMHLASTSGNYRSKPYIYASHRAVLNRFLIGASKGDDYTIHPARLFDGTPDYQFVRRHGAAAIGLFAPGALRELELHPVMTRSELSRIARSVPADVVVVHLHDGQCDPDGEASIAEAVTMFDLFPDTVMVGGRIHDGEYLLEAGYVFGYGGAVGCPDAGRTLGDPGYFAQSWKPRSVGAVSARHAYVRRDFLVAAAAALPDEVDIGMLGPWLGAVARETGGRVICSPYVSARGRSAAASPTGIAAALFIHRFPALGRDVTGYARHLDKSGLRPYAPNREPAARPLPDYPIFLDAALASRARDWPAGPEGAPTVSILTTVYVKSPASLFEETARAVRRQTHRPLEWLVLAQGPISSELEAALSRFAAEGLLTVLREDTNLGIQGGLRRCLEAASGDYVMVLDADDLLTRDAVQILTCAAAREPSAAIFYSDEDLLIGGEPRHPFYRPDFDPVLLTATSFAWHAILFRREVGLSVGAFSFEAAEYAQDWGSLVRFHLAGHQPVHIPAVLYHWRQHEASKSNSGKLFDGSIRSVQGVLGALRDASPMADRLRVAPYPVSLGIESFYLERMPEQAPPVQIVPISPSGPGADAAPDLPNARWSEAGDGTFAAIGRALDDGSEEFVLLLGGGIESLDGTGYWQALKHLEMHPACWAVGGPILDGKSRIVRGPLVAVFGDLVDEAVGHPASDPGPFSLSLQAHAVATMGPDCLLIRRDGLRDLLASRPPDLPLGAFALWLAEHAAGRERIVVYEPLLRARGKAGSLVGESPDVLNLRIRSGRWAAAASGRVRGTAGFIGAREMHA